MHYHQRSKLVKEWREHFCKEALNAKIPMLDQIAIEVRVKSRINNLPDTGACFCAQKAAVDGLIDAGVIVDDAPEWVKWITFFPVTYEKGVDELSIRIVEL